MRTLINTKARRIDVDGMHDACKEESKQSTHTVASNESSRVT